MHAHEEVQETQARQVNDLFDSSELAKAIHSEDFRHFLDHVPIAIVVSKLLSGDEARAAEFVVDEPAKPRK